MNAPTLAQSPIARIGFADHLSMAFATACSGIAKLAQAVRNRRDRAHLYAMPDHLLKDIGISRSEIDHAVAFGRAHAGRGEDGAMRPGTTT